MEGGREGAGTVKIGSGESERQRLTNKHNHPPSLPPLLPPSPPTYDSECSLGKAPKAGCEKEFNFKLVATSTTL